MKKPSDQTQHKTQIEDLDDDLRPEYDEETLRGLLRGGRRGVYAERYAQGTNLVKLDPDVAAVFATPEAVNVVLRALIQTMPQMGHIEVVQQKS